MISKVSFNPWSAGLITLGLMEGWPSWRQEHMGEKAIHHRVDRNRGKGSGDLVSHSKAHS
jgi:hypothetical protein